MTERSETTMTTILTRRQIGTLLGAAAGSAALVGGAPPALAAPPGAEGPTGPLVHAAGELLRRMRVPSAPRTAGGPVWAPLATGFAGVPDASLPPATAGGRGGRLLTAPSVEDFLDAAGAPAPATVP